MIGLRAPLRHRDRSLAAWGALVERLAEAGATIAQIGLDHVDVLCPPERELEVRTILLDAGAGVVDR